MTIRLGPAGMGKVKEVEHTFEEFKGLGIKASEIPFTYGVYIKKKEDALRVKKYAEKFGIQLSIHAPYWINLNSEDSEIVEKSKERILACCEIGTLLGADIVVFHPGYFGKRTKEESYGNIRFQIQEMMKICKEKKYTVKLAPETTGRLNVFGSLDEIEQLGADTGCGFCIDFAHLLARYKSYSFDEVKKRFGKYRKWHVHFSGIEYGTKGEKKHKRTQKKEWKKLLKNLPKDKEIIIINEGPNPLADTILGIEILRSKGF